MPKEFITERDIEDMARRGEMQLALSEDVVLTDLAFEKAQRLGVTLNRPNLQPPAAPIRPYLSNVSTSSSKNVLGNETSVMKPSFHSDAARSASSNGELKKRVIDAVMNRLGGQVDVALISTIVERVMADLGIG